MHDQSQSILTLSARDRKKAVDMLSNANMSNEGPEPEWRRDLQIMLLLNVKAELQILDSQPGGLSRVLETLLPLHDPMTLEEDATTALL